MNRMQVTAALLLGLGLMSAAAVAASKDGSPAAAAEAAYAGGGADTCLKCHDETSEFPVMAIFQSRHGQASDARTPVHGLQCEACHGPSAAHAGRVRPGGERPAVPNFARSASAPVADQNQACLGCHRERGASHWDLSAHADADLSCASCHRLHVTTDPVLDRRGELAVCGSCHRRQQTQSLLPSAHRLHSGAMRCGDCHAVHDAGHDKLLQADDTNAVCAQCHADKRGPLLWEHAPVSEDCTLCHRPHGSNHPALLTQRAPLLCQQCHTLAGHPGAALGPDDRPSTLVSLRACSNCHTQVHGSNHPSGALLLR